MPDTVAVAYDASQHPAFAVTVDVAVFTMVDSQLNLLLVSSTGGRPVRGCLGAAR